MRELYTSITEKAVNEVLKFAKEYTRIFKDKKNINKHCRS